MKFFIKVGKQDYLIDSLYESIYDGFKEYIISNSNNYKTIKITLEDMEENLDTNYYTREALESVIILRKIAEDRLFDNEVIVHGASLKYKENGYIFMAQSGVGKTTHVRLWKQYLKEKVSIINGDKPLLDLSNPIKIHGTPWMGKENLGKNIVAPLKAIVLIKRGKENTIKKIDTMSAFMFIYGQVFLIDEPKYTEKALEAIDKLLTSIEVYELTCDISYDAFKTSFEALTKETI